MGRAREVLELTRVRVLLFLREPEAVFWVFIFPILLALVLGFAFQGGPADPSRVAVLAGTGAEELAERLREDPSLDVEVAPDEEAAMARLAEGGLDVVVAPSKPPEVRYNSDREEGELALLRVDRAIDAASSGSEGATMSERAVEGRGDRYVDFLFPGLIGMNLMGTGIWGIGFAIVDMRQKKLLKRFLVTPMSRASFLLSFFLSRLVFMVLEVVVILAFGTLVLDVPLAGSVVTLSAVCILGALAFGGLGLLIASRPQTLEGVSGVMNFSMLPMWLFSGVFFSYERFPEWSHALIKAIPLTPLIDALRGCMLRGDGVAEIAADLAILLAWGVLGFFLALRVFRWK